VGVQYAAKVRRAQAQDQERSGGGRRGLTRAAGLEQRNLAEDLTRSQRRQGDKAVLPGRRDLGAAFGDQVESVARFPLSHHRGAGRIALLLKLLGQFLERWGRQACEGGHPLKQLQSPLGGHVPIRWFSPGRYCPCQSFCGLPRD
jgi:hypothetical protein